MPQRGPVQYQEPNGHGGCPFFRGTPIQPFHAAVSTTAAPLRPAMAPLVKFGMRQGRTTGGTSPARASSSPRQPLPSQAIDQQGVEHRPQQEIANRIQLDALGLDFTRHRQEDQAGHAQPIEKDRTPSQQGV